MRFFSTCIETSTGEVIFRLCLGNHSVELSWVQLPSPVWKTLSDSRCDGLLALTVSPPSIPQCSLSLSCVDVAIWKPHGQWVSAFWATEAFCNGLYLLPKGACLVQSESYTYLRVLWMGLFHDFFVWHTWFWCTERLQILLSWFLPSHLVKC